MSLYSRPGNDFTRRFPLIADAPPEWLSKKCRPLSKKCKLNRPSEGHGDAGADEPVPVDKSTPAVPAPPAQTGDIASGECSNSDD